MEGSTHVPFVDEDAVLVTRCKKLRRGRVVGIFEKWLGGVCVLGSTAIAGCCADAAPSHATRRVLYTDLGNIVHEYGAGTGRCIDPGIHADWFINALYTRYKHKCMLRMGEKTWVISHDNSVARVSEHAHYSVLPSSAPDGLDKGLIYLYDSPLERYRVARNGKETGLPFDRDSMKHIIRVFRDVFLVHDFDIKGFVLRRIIAPCSRQQSGVCTSLFRAPRSSSVDNSPCSSHA